MEIETNTFANAMASQPAKLNNSENHIACITISTRNGNELKRNKFSN